MKAIEDIWKKGNEQVGQDDSYTPEAILKSIAEASGSITAGLLKPLRFGIAVAVMALLMFGYNAFFYSMNLPLMISILVFVFVSMAIIIYLWDQIKSIRDLDQTDMNLHELLTFKIRYLNTPYNRALHCISLAIVLATFTINLTIENTDGIFELRKILILSAFYLPAYLFTYGLIKLSINVINKQLKNALFNLEEQTLISLDLEFRKQRRVNRIIVVCLIVLTLAGLAFMLFS